MSDMFVCLYSNEVTNIFRINPLGANVPPDKTPTSLALDVAPRTGKIIKNDVSVIERGENFLQNGMLQSSEIVLQS